MIRSFTDRPRNRRVLRAVLAAAAAAAATAAFAQDHALAAKAGALGLGVEYAYSINDRVAVRLGLNGSELGFDAEESGINYDFDLVWDSAAVAVDFHPTGGALRVFAGLLANDNRLEAEGRVNGAVTIGDTSYDSEDVGTLIGLVEFDERAPFIGVGWDWSRRRARRVGVSFDLGVVKQGAPTVSLEATGPIAEFPDFADDVAAEEAQLADELDGLDVVPFATLGIVFRF